MDWKWDHDGGRGKKNYGSGTTRRKEKVLLREKEREVGEQNFTLHTFVYLAILLLLAHAP